MTNKINPMKILDEAVVRAGSISALQKLLVRRGISVSPSALSQAKGKSKESLRLDILAGIVDVAFDGDWKLAGKLLSSEFLPKKA